MNTMLHHHTIKACGQTASALGLAWVVLFFGLGLFQPIQLSAQSRPLSGFKNIVLVLPVYEDGSIDKHGFGQYLKDRLSPDWMFITNEMAASDRKLLSQTLFCSLNHSWQNSLSNDAEVVCGDVFGVELVRIRESATSAFTIKGDIKKAIRNIEKRLRALRPAFDSAKTIDILSTISNIERHPVTREILDQHIAEQALTHPLEGIWSSGSAPNYEVGIVRDEPTGTFVAVILDSPDNILWDTGMVKFRLTEAADRQTLLARYRMGNHQEFQGTGTLDGSVLRLVLHDATGETLPIEFIKLRPANHSAASSTQPPITATGTGTGFVVASGLIATNQHVVANAARVEIVFSERDAPIALDVVVSDAFNDLALLRPSDSQRLPTALPVADFGQMRLGQDAIVIGFPLGAALGESVKVTTGVVSAIEGLNGDPRMLQLTAPIQPGSSGSPVFAPDGTVIGIVTATLNNAGNAATEAIPQNVNFAMKSDYLSLLLRNVDVAFATTPLQGSTETADLIEQVRRSVGMIRVFR